LTVIAIFTSTTPSVALTVGPTTASVPQGGNGTATVTLARNFFTGAVTLAVTGAPQGLAVTPNPASITGTTSTLDVSASASLAAGNYPLTITATGTGIAPQSANFAVQVSPAPGGSNDVSMSFATCDPGAVPIWFAVQSGNGAWTRVTAGPNSAFTFTPGATGGVAFVTPDGGGFRTEVILGSASEIIAIATGPGPCFLNPQVGIRQVKGSASHFGTTTIASVAIGGAQAALSQVANASFTLPNVAAGRRDLIGVQAATGGGTDTIIQKMVLRRNVLYANGGTAPDVDFIGLESFAPDRHTVTLTNLAGDQSEATLSLITPNGQSVDYFSDVGRFFPALGSDGVLSFGIPDALLLTGDFHWLSVYAGSSDGRSARFVQALNHSLPNQAFTFGPALSTPTVTSLGTSPYLRLRAQLPFQSAYDGGAILQGDQGANSVRLSASAGYFGGTPSTWIIDVPDFTGASYDPSWGLRGGAPTSWLVGAVRGSFLPFLGATMFDGAQITGALTSNSVAAFYAARAARANRAATIR
jgi:hypothetical protein